MRWGPTLEQLETVAERTGKIPQAIEDQPEVLPDMLPYWEAYGDLMSSRPVGMAVGAIPLSEIAAYNQLFPGLDVALLVRVVRELDRIYLDDSKQKVEAKSKSSPAPGRQPVGKAQLRKGNHGRGRA